MSKEKPFKYVGMTAIVIAGCLVGKFLVATMDHNKPSHASPRARPSLNLNAVWRLLPFQRVAPVALAPPMNSPSPSVPVPSADTASADTASADTASAATLNAPALSRPVLSARTEDRSPLRQIPLAETPPVVATVSPLVASLYPTPAVPVEGAAASEGDDSTRISKEDLDQLTARLEAQIAASLSRLHAEQLAGSTPMAAGEHAPEDAIRSASEKRLPDPRDALRAPTPLEIERANAAILQVEARAAALVAAGLDAGQRNATFTARDKMLDALRLVAQAADAASDSRVRSTVLTQGMVALEESTDFAKDADVFNDTLACERVVATHRSRVVSKEDASRMTHLSLQRAYLEYAQQKLTTAAEGSEAAAAALVGLAKFYLGRAVDEGLKREGPRAVALCQAALTVDPNNHEAANELGALLAQYGRLAESKEMLLRSLRGQPTISGWHNLAIVHSRLGETELAKLAEVERAALELSDKALKNRMGFVDKETFASTHPDADPAGLPDRSNIDGIGTPAPATQPASSAQPQTAGIRHWQR